ncbi:MAG: GNAT family N-acetyltransferase, partial [Verrucomicrobiales bacterium]
GPGESPAELILHKLYLDPDRHGRGYGSAAIVLLESDARERFPAASTVRLRVNKANNRAIRAYQRAGFARGEAVCSDIGGGFVMDDWWMEKRLTRNSTS